MSMNAMFDQYKAYAAESCGFDDAAPAQRMDSTAHVAGCTQAAALPIAGFVLLMCLLRWLLCPGRRRQLYAGSEDAPELEEIIGAGGRVERRVDSVNIASGRLVSNNAPQRPVAAARGKVRKGTGAASGKRKGTPTELQPVLRR